MSPIGFKQIRTSDLTGEILDDSDVVTVVIRSHPDLAEGKVFDASPVELHGLKGIEDLVELELQFPNGTTQTLVSTKEDFEAVVPARLLKTFDNSRGRRTGFRPNGNGS